MPDDRTIGIDCGSSGLRGVAIDATGRVLAEAQGTFPAGTTDPDVWASAMDAVLAELATCGPIDALAVDGTSGTLVLLGEHRRPCGPASLYNDDSAAELRTGIRTLAPPESAAHGATSPAARLLQLQQH